MPERVLFACVHNAGRSQMAAALFNQLADPQKAVALSAGTQPGEKVHPVVAEALEEIGLDVGHLQPRLLTPELARSTSLLVTMGCGEACPFVPGLKTQDWPLDDPKGQPLEVVRQIREDIAGRMARLIEEYGWGK